jgi:hypothetical protein
MSRSTVFADRATSPDLVRLRNIVPRREAASFQHVELIGAFHLGLFWATVRAPKQLL